MEEKKIADMADHATDNELRELQARLERKYDRLTRTGPEAREPEVLLAKDPTREPVYLYEGVRGRIKVNGVEVDMATLSEAERITAGEQLLKQIAEQEGKSVKEVRADIGTIATNVQAAKGKPPATLRLVKTDHGERPMLTHSGMNRKQRRAARSKG